jgi:hypothetical protein
VVGDLRQLLKRRKLNLLARSVGPLEILLPLPYRWQDSSNHVRSTLVSVDVGGGALL